jgi:hypothetical protein
MAGEPPKRGLARIRFSKRWFVNPRVSHTELGMDSEIVVKIRHEPLRQELRKVQPAEIVQSAERARALAAKSIPSLSSSRSRLHCRTTVPFGRYQPPY